MMYLFISENKIEAYNGEILKRYVGNRLVKTIANPTEQDLKEFGYKPLKDSEGVPEYDEATQCLVEKYTDTADEIIKKYTVHDFVTEEENVYVEDVNSEMV